MARRFTRQAFYDLVWSKPMTQLAKEFALSDVALHKICRKHGIPTPPVGWWAKQAAGKAVERTPLPDAHQEDVEIVIAGADLTATDTALAGAREKARVLASSGTVSSPAAMHPAIGRTLAALRKARPSAQGLVATEGTDRIRCTISPASIDRLADFLPALLSAAAVQGFDLEPAEGGVRFRSTAETVTVSISEALDRTPHVKTDAEKAREAAWTRKREESRRRNSWSFLVDDRPVFPEWDYAPSGKLGLELEQVWTRARTGPRRAFRDGKTQTLESMVADIAVGLAVLATAKTEERLRQEAWKRDYQEEQARREQAARAARVDERRRGALDAILADMDSLDRMRRLMTGLRSEQASEPDQRVATFLAWADAEVERRSAGLSAAGLEARLRSDGLFGEDDDRGYGDYRWM